MHARLVSKHNRQTDTKSRGNRSTNWPRLGINEGPRQCASHISSLATKQGQSPFHVAERLAGRFSGIPWRPSIQTVHGIFQATSPNPNPLPSPQIFPLLPSYSQRDRKLTQQRSAIRAENPPVYISIISGNQSPIPPISRNYRSSKKCTITESLIHSHSIGKANHGSLRAY